MGYDTTGSHVLADFFMILREDLLAKVSYPGRLTRRDIIPQGDRLARISNHEKIDRPGYHTPGRLKNLNNSANS